MAIGDADVGIWYSVTRASGYCVMASPQGSDFESDLSCRYLKGAAVTLNALPEMTIQDSANHVAQVR